ncbi:fido domain-containing protein [Ochromonadaceae sp. CCMP2298]|nr:fido domain-containing protein [Ochromonadaceae sp. CCMP2298]|mmetsp:Transcript_11627/g.25911  ORF Transcript_11627/g.25911 Transcript_11627/m.25911 type:complete len:300 (-) Transcript_11627:372-1271(-)
MAVSSNKFVAKEWLLSDPESAFTSVVEFMDTFQDARIDGKEQYHLVFAKQMVLTNIFTSNKLEGTLSSSLSHSDTYGLLGSLYDDVDKDKLDVPPIHWKADGDGDAKATRFQLACHLDAVLYMTSEDMITRDLDVDDVLTVHRLMMKNATEKDGTFLRSGDFHNVDVRAGEHLYPPGNPGALREACEKIVAEFNSSLGAEGKCFIEVTSKLFYDMITLHPFSDGNGRFCRLLVTYALRRAGFPFSIPLSSHHKKSRNHYMLAILECRCTGKMQQLNSLILTSMNYVMRNYSDNVRVMNV